MIKYPTLFRALKPEMPCWGTAKHRVIDSRVFAPFVVTQ